MGDEAITILCDALRESTVSKVEELDLCSNGIGREDGAKAIAALCVVRTSSLTKSKHITSQRDQHMYTNTAKGKGISLCGIKPGQTEANMQGSYPNFMKPPDAILLTADLAVRTSLTVTDLRYNKLDADSAMMLATVAKEKKISLCGITPGQTEADFTPSKNSFNRMKPADGILLTADIFVRAEALTKSKHITS